MTEKRQLYRDPDHGRIAGVCAGVADYFGIELWLVRIITLTGFILSGSFFLVGYVAAWFILDKKPGSKGTDIEQKFHQSVGKGWHSSPEGEKTVSVKGAVWQSGEPPRQAFYDIRHQFKDLEGRLRNMETFVTSSEFQLKREINRL